jgi:hypothetical protein
MASKAEMLTELKQMLHDVFVQRTSGVTHARLARAHGYVDGYMRALLDGGHTTKQELLQLVAAERASVSGPATRVVTLEAAAAESVAA